MTVSKLLLTAPAVISARHFMSNLRLYTPLNVDETCLEPSSAAKMSASVSCSVCPASPGACSHVVIGNATTDEPSNVSEQQTC